MKVHSIADCRLPTADCEIHKSRFAYRKSERGMATFVCIALLAVMLVLVMAESSALFHLHREVKLLEQKQIKRLDASQTNSVIATKPESK